MLEEKQGSGFCSLGFHPLVSSPSNFVEGSGIVELLFLAAAFKMTELNLSNGYSLEKTWAGVRGRAGWNRFDPWHHTASLGGVQKSSSLRKKKETPKQEDYLSDAT